MRPLTLELQGIGPFVSKLIIDFESLDDRSLFLIHGPTGQGKTFLFDAIYYALFAETPAGRESHLKSDFLPDGEEPWIDFRFRLGTSSYRVHRCLKYERPKNRGEGTTGAPETQLLVKLRSDGSDGEILAEKKSEVNSQLKNLLGLEAGQFRQVVMIPQGEFRELLLSKSEDRETLLENLFDTEVYKNVQDRLKVMEDEAGREERSATDMRDQKMQDLTDLWQDEELDSSLYTSEDSEILEPFEVRLESALSELRNRAAELAGRAAESGKLRDKAVSDFEVARVLSENHRRLKELETQKADLESGTPSMNRLKNKINEGRRALALKDRYEELRNARDSAEEAGRLLSEAQNRLGQLLEQKADLDNKEADMPLYQGQVTLLDRRIRISEGFRDEEHRRREIRRDLDLAGKNRDESLRMRRSWKERQGAAIERQTALEKEQGLLKEEAPPGGRPQRIRLLETLLERKAELPGILKSAESARIKAADSFQQQKQAGIIRDELKVRRDAEMAGVLASELEDGKPCPVCGALHHPSPAAKGDVPEGKELDSAESAYLKSVSAVREAELRADAEALRAEELRNEIQAVESGLISESPTAFEYNPERIPELIRELKEQIQREDDIRTEWEQLLKSELPGLSAESERLAAESSQYERDYQHLKSNLDTLESRWDTAMSGWPEDDMDSRPIPEKLSESLDAWIAEKARLENDIRVFAEKRQHLSESLLKAKTEESVRSENLQAATKNLTVRETAFSDSLGESDFTDEPALEQAISRAEALDHDTRTLEVWESGMKDIISRIHELQQRIENRQEPDMHAVDEKRVKALSDAEDLSRRSAAAEQNLKRHKQLQAELQKMESAHRGRELHNGVLRRLSGQVRGTLPPKISLNRFFLARRLEEVLIQATRRLAVLSRGRFTLKRRDEGRTAGARAGLDLLISDAWTGTERPVNTLSGGQLFMASLSLALGLADVVQARSGGVKLEALFIDEGFGTLDDEALQDVLQVLNDLRENRMVGVISHVPELKRQISDRIEVFRTDPGSSARLVSGV